MAELSLQLVPSRLPAHALFYAGYYSMVGAILPYLPAYLRARGFSGADIGVLLSFSPLMLCIAPLFAGYLADRSRRPLLVLRIAVAGAILGIALLPLSPLLAWSAFAMLVYSAFQASIISSIDALTLSEIQRAGGSYPRVRLWGSAGFVVTALSLGFWLDARGVIDEVVVWIGAVALAVALLSTLGVRAPDRIGAPIRGAEALDLLRSPPLRWLLLASLLHWTAMSPYHSFFAIHTGALGLPTWVIGASMALGAAVEIGVMWGSVLLFRRFDAKTVLVISFAASALRWFLTAQAREPLAVVLVQALHGVSFGAFYVAAIGLLVVLVPERLRATGQGLFMAAVFGIGGGLGTLAAGFGFETLGGPGLFLTSAVVSVGSLLCALQIRRSPDDRQA